MKKRRFLALLLVCVFTMIPFVSNAATNDWKQHAKDSEFSVSGKDTVVTFSGYAIKDRGKWYHNKQGWWYQWSDGTYPTDTVLKIDGKYYQFLKNGYLYEAGYYKGEWFDGNGIMRFDRGCNGAQWYKDGLGWWYGTKVNGKLTWYKKNGWLKVDNKWYFFDGDGYILQNAVLQLTEYCSKDSGT